MALGHHLLCSQRQGGQSGAEAVFYPEYSLRAETSFLAVYSWPGPFTCVQGGLHQALPQRWLHFSGAMLWESWEWRKLLPLFQPCCLTDSMESRACLCCAPDLHPQGFSTSMSHEQRQSSAWISPNIASGWPQTLPSLRPSAARPADTRLRLCSQVMAAAAEQLLFSQIKLSREVNASVNAGLASHWYQLPDIIHSAWKKTKTLC